MKYMKIRTKEHKARNSFVSISVAILAVMMMSNIASVNAGPIEREQAKRIHDRLTGVPPADADLDFMENLIVNNGTFDGATGAVAAARYAMASEGAGSSRAKYFYNVTLKNWVTPWTNEEQTMFAPLNDYTALVIGMIRDDVPFNTVLSANLFYTGIGGGLPAFSNMNNDHFEALENNDVDLSRSSLFDSRPQNNLNGAPAGIVTTRQAGKAFFSEGTNRAMFRFTSMNYLCRDLEDLKDVTRVPDRIRQDVSRSPGGDSSIFLNSCVGCHAGMDPLAGAYAYYEWVEDADGNNGHVIYTPGDVQPKHHINDTNFEYGYRTVDDSWLNYWRQGPNAGLGWAGTAEVTSGNGAASMGQELANTEAFAQCQVEKVYKQVCLQEPISNHNADIATLTSRFMDTGDMNYRMKNLFAEVAALCVGN
jgi:hypothetical protein